MSVLDLIESIPRRPNSLTNRRPAPGLGPAQQKPNDMHPLALTLALLCWAEGPEQPAISLPPVVIDPEATRPPIAKKVPRERVVHGDRSVDDYDWLRDKSNPQVLSYLH